MVIWELLKTLAQCAASDLKDSMKGWGAMRTPWDYLLKDQPGASEKINRVYKEMYKIDLEKDIISETSGDCCK